MAVVLLPSPQDPSEHGRKISQPPVVLQLDPPSPDWLAIRALRGRFQLLWDVEEDAGFVVVLEESRHEEGGIEIVVQSSDVELDRIVLAPATASSDGDRFQRRFSGPIAIGVAMEDR